MVLIRNIVEKTRKVLKKQALMVAVICAVTVSANVSAYAGVNNMDYIVHAGGQAGYSIGTNSREAVNNSFMNGYRYIEMDFNFTSDGELVCVHDWDTDYFKMGKPKGKALSLNEFKYAKILGQYTTMSAEQLAWWLHEKPDTYIITDIKENNIAGLKYIAEHCGYVKDKIIPQIYSESEYDKVKAMGYKNIIYTLYKLSYSEKTNTSKIVKFAKNHDIYAITFSDELASEKYVNALKKSGKKLYVHTVNSTSQAEKLSNMGINGIYSDYTKENLKA